MDQKSIDKLVQLSTAEAAAASAVWQAARVASDKNLSDDNESPPHVTEKLETSDANDELGRDVRLHPRAVIFVANSPLLCVSFKS